MNFKIVIEKDEDGSLVATCPSLPGCISQGKTERESIKNLKEAIQLHVKTLAQDGIPLKLRNGKKEILISVAV